MIFKDFFFQTFKFTSRNHLCSDKSGRSPSRGDEGGALIYKLGSLQNKQIERYMVIGVYNTGQNPAVFTKITKDINKVFIFKKQVRKILRRRSEVFKIGEKLGNCENF